MDYTTLLKECKARLAITDDYHDAQLTALIHDAVDYLTSAGVSAEVLESEKSYGCILRGVVDLWNQEPGSAGFSSLFRERAIQLMEDSEGEG